VSAGRRCGTSLLPLPHRTVGLLALSDQWPSALSTRTAAQPQRTLGVLWARERARARNAVGSRQAVGLAVQLVAGAPLRACTAIAVPNSHAQALRAPQAHAQAQGAAAPPHISRSRGLGARGCRQTAQTKQQMQAVC
jgi:hypothetical protein